MSKKLSDELGAPEYQPNNWGACKAITPEQVAAIRDLETQLEAAERKAELARAERERLFASGERAVLDARIEELERAEQGLFEAIRHGAEDHQAWLKGMMHGWFQARIAELKAKKAGG